MGEGDGELGAANSGDGPANPINFFINSVQIGNDNAQLNLYGARRERGTAPAGPPPVPLAAQVAQVHLARLLAPARLEDREAELGALARQSTGDEGYFFWEGERAAGKTALLATFVAEGAPESAYVVSFFISRTTVGRADARAFTTEVCEQLCAILGEELPAAALRRTHLHRLYEQAASAVRGWGWRLVLVVDALDEDRWGLDADMPSIASLLPGSPVPGLTVIVSGRSGVDWQSRLPDDHPLQRCERIPLAASSHATNLIGLAKRDLEQYHAARTRHWQAIGLLAAAGGGLSREDMRKLLGAEPPDVERLFWTELDRIIAERDEVLQFRHDTLHEEAVRRLGSGIEDYRRKIHAWAGEFDARQWPEDTPRYLIRGYPEILRGPDDIGVMVRLATSPQRQYRLLEHARGDAGLAMAQVDAAARAVFRLAEPDLTAMARLAISRDALEHPYLHIPPRLPAVWALLGEQHRAETLASLIADPVRRAEARRVLAAVTEADPWPEVERRLRSLARKIARGRRRQNADKAIGQAELILGSITDPARCADAVATLAGAVVAWDPYHRAARLVAALADDELRARAREVLIDALVRTGRRGTARALIAEADDGEPRARAEAAYAGALARHGHLPEADRVAHRITHERWYVRALAELCVVHAGAGRVAQANALLRDIPDAGRDFARFRMAQTLAEAGAIPAARTVARSIGVAYDQQRTFVLMVPRLAERGEVELATELVGSITFRDLRFRAALALARVLLTRNGDVGQVTDLSRELLAEPEAQVQLLAGCAPDMASSGVLAEELLTRAAALAGDVAGQPARARAVAMLAEANAALAEAYAALGDHARARQAAEQSEDLARSVPYATRLASDLTAVTQALSGRDAKRAVALAERALALMGDLAVGEKFTLQVELMKALSAGPTQASVRDLAREITGPFRKPEYTVKVVGAACTAGLVDDAVEMARSIPDPAYRSSALAACARARVRTGGCPDAGEVGAGQANAAQLVREAEKALQSANWAALPAKHTLGAALEAGCDKLADRVFQRAWQEALDSGDAGVESLIDLLRVGHEHWPAARTRNLARLALTAAGRIDDAETRMRAIRRLSALAGEDAAAERADAAAEPAGAVEGADAAAERTDAVEPGDAAGAAGEQAGAGCAGPRQPSALERIQSMIRLVRGAPDGLPSVPTWIAEASRLAENLEDAGQRARERAQLAEAAARAGQRDVARELIGAARADSDLIAVPDTSRTAASALAIAASAAGDVPGARDALRRAAAFVPVAWPADVDNRQVEQLARTVADAGDHAHALVLARTIDDPEASALARLAIARSLIKQGNPARARALVKALRGGQWAQGLATLAQYAVEESRHDLAEELLAAAVEATRNLAEQRARDEAAAAVVRAAVAALDYYTATEALAMITDAKHRDEAFLTIARGRVKLRDYAGAEEDVKQIRNPADNVHGRTLFIRAGWDGEDGSRPWAAEGARYVAEIPKSAERVRVGASFAQALAETGRRDEAAALIRREEPIAAGLTGSARSGALEALARAAMSATDPDLAASLVEAISDPRRRTRAQRGLLLTSTLADGMTLEDPESGGDSVEHSWLLLAGATRGTDFSLPDRRRFIAEALISVRWTTALGPLGHVDPDALLAVADDFLA